MVAGGLCLFAGAVGLGILIRLLEEAGGRSVGARIIVWSAVSLLAVFLWRAARRYRRLEKRSPASALAEEFELRAEPPRAREDLNVSEEDSAPTPPSSPDSEAPPPPPEP